jgi:hypothetical protein
MLLVAQLPELTGSSIGLCLRVARMGSHRSPNALLYVACDSGSLAAVDALIGAARQAACRSTGRNLLQSGKRPVHVAIADPGLVQSIDPHTGNSTRFDTALGAKTTPSFRPIDFVFRLRTAECSCSEKIRSVG